MRAVFSLLLLCVFAGNVQAKGFSVTFKDPAGDDKGPGTYVYPTAPEYSRGSFDLLEVELREKGKNLEITIEVNARIEDPWNSKDWTPPGQGFSLQFVQIYIDTDGKEGSGHIQGLPGLNVDFAPKDAWDKAILISPQPISRLESELKSKASGMARDVIIPGRITVKGKKLVALVPLDKLGKPQDSWGWQVVMQSNEGYPDGNKLLTRDVNEIEGEHRFGGGSDWDCDPHVIDILAGEARGEAAEAKLQYEALSYKCVGSGGEGSKRAVLPMIRRNKQ